MPGCALSETLDEFREWIEANGRLVGR